jgi:hypothetical protein
MDSVVNNAFLDGMSDLREDIGIMPMSRWNKSVFRYCFCRSIAKNLPKIELLIECDRIDLVLSHGSERAFVEFKFYRHPKRFDPYIGGEPIGFKGGPGKKNLGEFAACVEQLHDRRSLPGLSKYVVLVYVDPTDDSRPNNRFSLHYDDYQHSRLGIDICSLSSSESFESSEGIVKGRLYKIGASMGSVDIDRVSL